MKKTTLTLLMIAGLFTATLAQGVEVGLRAGLNMSNVAIDVEGFSVSPDAKPSFLAGAYAVFMLSEKLGLQAEAQYAASGYKLEIDGTDFGADFNYVNVPVFLRYNITEMINFHVGPQFGILLSAKSDGEDIKDGFKGSDFSAIGGLGIDFPFGLNGGLRYSLGLSNIDDTGADGTLKNRAFQVYVGYKLFGKKK